MAKHRMRRGEAPPLQDGLALRGGEFTEAVLQAAAEFNYELYGFHGISMWVPAAASQLETLAATKLRGSRELRIFRVETCSPAACSSGTPVSPRITML